MTHHLLTWSTPDNVDGFLREITEHDGVEAFSEQFVLGFSDARLGHRHVCAHVDGALVGLAAVSGRDVELAVLPGWRRQGIGSSLVRAVWKEIDGAGVWAHGNLPQARSLAESFGLRAVRRLLVMGWGAGQLGEEVVLPEGYELFDATESRQRYGEEHVEKQWLKVNNDAFEWHPEQGGWDLERLRRAQEVEWFDPRGVLFIWDAERLAGFHWTKVHPDKVGEIYVVGLHSDYRGRGLGGPLTVAGVRHLVSERGVDEVILYVEENNKAAVRRYEKTGFTVVEEHVVYA